VRGTISAADGKAITVNGEKILLGEKTEIVFTQPIALAEIKPGDFLGVTSVRQADGKLVAYEVRRFPKPLNPGHRPFDGRADQTMTNAAVDATVSAADGRELTVVSVPRPDRRLDVLLPSAELSVIRRLVEGLSYIDIARARGTSTRTIANQITAVFRRLKVSGRNELVQQLFLNESDNNWLVKGASKTLVPPGMAESKTDASLDSSRRSA